MSDPFRLFGLCVAGCYLGLLFYWVVHALYHPPGRRFPLRFSLLPFVSVRPVPSTALPSPPPPPPPLPRLRPSFALPDLVQARRFACVAAIVRLRRGVGASVEILGPAPDPLSVACVIVRGPWTGNRPLRVYGNNWTDAVFVAARWQKAYFRSRARSRDRRSL